jgi:hypothetical protein
VGRREEIAVLWILIALAVLVVGFAVRDLLRRPDPTATPDPRPHGRAVGTQTDWARAWHGLGGGGPSGSSGGGLP